MTTKSSVQSLRGPQWWLVSLSIPLMAGMLFVDHRLKLSAFWHQFFGVAMILLVYGLMGVWLWLNSDSFDDKPIHLVLTEESDSIIVYTVEEDEESREDDQEQESGVRLATLPDDGNAEFDIKAAIGEIEAELQSEYTRLHRHHV